jgi:16S rRNA (cytosine967-C5)-methyltransferase
MAAVSPARREAFRILLAVGRGTAHADDLLRGSAVSALAPVDRHLATALVLGVLRWQIWLDDQIRPLLKRPGAKLDLEILTALRLGAFQLLFLDRVPAHAAIGESVELAKQAGHRFASGMVNAVLRKLVQHETLREDAAAQAAVDAHPAWMVERWIAFYGQDAVRAICAHGQSQPAPVVRLQHSKMQGAKMEGSSDEGDRAQSGVQFAPGALLACAREVSAGDVTAMAAFLEGRVRIQDEGSQLIAELAARGGDNRNQTAKGDPDVKSVLDACAAPGGKTLVLAERMPQAHIVACEASAARLAPMRERLAAYADRIECRHADAAALEETSAFDLALVDAPCSGTGTLGRNPEIRHRVQPEDFARHAERQRTLLRAALRAVRPGGCVVYSTCSLEPEENEQVVAVVLAESRDVRQVSLASRIDRLREGNILTDTGAEKLHACLTQEGALRLLPGALRTDGFYVALLERNS